MSTFRNTIPGPGRTTAMVARSCGVDAAPFTRVQESKSVDERIRKSLDPQRRPGGGSRYAKKARTR